MKRARAAQDNRANHDQQKAERDGDGDDATGSEARLRPMTL